MGGKVHHEESLDRDTQFRERLQSSLLQTELHEPCQPVQFHPEIAVLAVYVQMQVTLLTKPLPAESSVNHLGIDLFVCFFPLFPSNKTTF